MVRRNSGRIVVIEMALSEGEESRASLSKQYVVSKEVYFLAKFPCIS